MRNPGLSQRHARGQQGYNLVEVLIAMAMLGTVLIGIVTLFVMGQRNVYSGKQMTRAVSVGTRVTEDLAPLTRGRIEQMFGLTGATPGTVTAGGETFTNSIVRSTATDAGVAGKDVDGYLTNWAERLTIEEFNDGKVLLVITAVDPVDTPTFESAPLYRIRIFVEWNEGLRQRRVVLDTSKFDRTN